MNADAQHLIAHLQRGGAYGYWWTAEGKQSFWWNTAEPASLPNGRRNTYFGVHPVVTIPETNSRGEHAESRSLRSQIAVIAAINCLFAEFDAKDFEHDKAKTLAAIDALDPPPSTVVDSGGGYHCYWLLDQPYPLATDAARREAAKLQAAWVRLMGGDTAAKDLARVLRVPGTKNYKYDPPRDVQVIKVDGPRYSLEELATYAAPFIESDKPSTVASGELPSERYAAAALAGELAKLFAAPDGQKHHQTFKSAAALGELIGAGLLDEQTVKDLLLNAIAPRAADVKGAANTIRDGIAKGKTNPRQISESQPVNTNGITFKKSTEYVVDWRSQGVTLAQLQHKQFAAERWIVEDIFPEGACLLAAKYKSKKSWLALAISLAVAMNTKALGRLGVSSGRVLYLDLEGKQQRIQKRTRAMLGVVHVTWPDNFHIFTKWPQGDEGLQELEGWLKSYSDTALVVIDVLASFRRPMQKHEEVYRYDRDTIDPLNALFETYHAGGLLIHHFNKGKHDDIMDSITGSTGLPSAVNTMWGFTRDPNDSNITIMHMRGRDLENDDPLALRWDSYLNQHVIEGPASEVAISTERKAILTLLGDDEPRTPKEIAAELGRPVTAVQFLLRKLLNDGLIDKPVYGKYARIPAQSAQTTQSAQSAQSAQSERKTLTLSGTPVPPQSSVGLPKAINSHSEHSERDSMGADFWAHVPPDRRDNLRMYLRSNMPKDQEEAQRLCRLYDIDYDQARKAVQ